jgi:hypothetical protein
MIGVGAGWMTQALIKAKQKRGLALTRNACWRYMERVAIVPVPCHRPAESPVYI